MANPSVRAVGAVSAAASGNVSPALPTGWQNNDIGLLVVATLDNVALSVSGWTLIDVVKTNGSGFQTALYRRRLQTGDTAPTVTHTSGSGISAFIIAIQNASTAGTGMDVVGAWRANASSTTCTADQVTTVNPNSLLLMFAGVGAKLTLSSWSNSLVEDQDGPNTNSRPEVGDASATQAAAGATGSRTCTVSGAGAINNGILVAVRGVQTASTTKTSDGRVKAQASTTKTSDGRAKAQASTTKTSDGRAKAQASTTKTSDGRAKAQASTTKTSDGRTKAQASTTGASDGRVKAQASTTKTSDGRARVQTSTTSTSDGRIKAAASTTKASDGRVFSPASSTKTSDGRILGQASTTVASDGRAKAIASATKTSDGRAKAGASTTGTSDGRAKARASTSLASDGRNLAVASTSLFSNAKVGTNGGEEDVTSDGRVKAQASVTKDSDGRILKQASWTFASDCRVFAKAAADMLSDTSVAHRGEMSMTSSAGVKARSAIDEPYVLEISRTIGGTVVSTPVSSLQLGLSLSLVVLGKRGRAAGRKTIALEAKADVLKLRVTDAGLPFDLSDVTAVSLELRRPYAVTGLDLDGKVLDAERGLIAIPVIPSELPEGELLATVRLVLSGGAELIAPQIAPIPLISE